MDSQSRYQCSYQLRRRASWGCPKPGPVVNFVVLGEKQRLDFGFPEHLRIPFIFHSKVNTKEYQGQVFGNLSCDNDLGVGLGWAKLPIKLHLIEIYGAFFSGQL